MKEIFFHNLESENGIAYMCDDGHVIIHSPYGLFTSCRNNTGCCDTNELHWHRLSGARVWARIMTKLEIVIRLGITEERVQKFGSETKRFDSIHKSRW